MAPMTGRRGRPRSRAKGMPAHIDHTKLPDYCYWDNSGDGHWFTVFKVDGIPHRRRIAGRKALLSELVAIMESRAGSPHDCLNWLADEFRKSAQFTDLDDDTKKDWDNCRRIVCTYPTAVVRMVMGEIPLGDWDTPLVQLLVDGIGRANGPSSARHCCTYLKRLFNWGMPRGYVKANPVVAIELPKERGRKRLPKHEVIAKLAELAQKGAAQKPRTKGSCPFYIWPCLEFAYLLRLRGVEIFDLSDADTLEEGILCERRKGSDDNITEWNGRLLAVVQAAQAYREEVWVKLRKPIPFKPEDRLLLVNEQGERIKPFAWQNAWKRFLAQAKRLGILDANDEFGLHDMKRRGVTDTEGTRSERMEASGHKHRGSFDRYDFKTPVVKAAGESKKGRRAITRVRFEKRN